MKNVMLSASLAVALCGCSSFSHTNVALKQEDAPRATKASFTIQQDRGKKEKVLFILSLSGGGSRAAYFSAATMLALEKVFEHEDINLLDEVDIISSVSGGSLPAAYYAVSADKKDADNENFVARRWDEDTVKELMSRNYKARWIGNWFWPVNIAKYWFTAFDRTDIMAQTFADNMFDQKTRWNDIFNNDLKIKDIQKGKPNIIINATDGTKKYDKFSGHYDIPYSFTFTEEDFKKFANSDIGDYDVSRAVMASASFPAVFNSMTLRNFSKNSKDRYMHIFDGGNIDNLGLGSVERVITENIAKSDANNYDKIIVMLIDSHTDNTGISSDKYDGRDMFSYIADLNFLDSFDSLLAANRLRIIKHFNDYLAVFKNSNKYKYIFYHLSFDKIKDNNLRNKLNSIPTDFSISSSSMQDIDNAVKQLINPENDCLMKIKKMISDPNADVSSGQCD